MTSLKATLRLLIASSALVLATGGAKAQAAPPDFVDPACLGALLGSTSTMPRRPRACLGKNPDRELLREGDGFLYSYDDNALPAPNLGVYDAYKVVDRLRANGIERDLVWFRRREGGTAIDSVLLITPPVDAPSLFATDTVVVVQNGNETLTGQARFVGPDGVEYDEADLAFGWVFRDDPVQEEGHAWKRNFGLGPIKLAYSPATSRWYEGEEIGFGTYRTDLTGKPQRLISVTLERPADYPDFASRCFNEKILAPMHLPATMTPDALLALGRRFADVCFISNRNLEPFVRDEIDRYLKAGELPR